jgi:RNA polymerase sigma-70 factor (ECF subfamily)
MELDRATLQRAQAGGKEAQSLFLRRYAGPLRALVRRLGGGGDLDDQLQELLLALLKALPRFRPEGPASLTTWVFAVAHRQLLAGRRRPRLQLVPLDEAADLAAGDPPVDQLLGDKRLGLSLEAALAQLSPAHRTVFVLTQLHQQPLEAVAEVEQVPLGTIKSRLHRARAELVLLLGPLLAEAGGGRDAAGR